MWYPPPVLVPMYLEPNALRFADRPAPAMWPTIPVKQHFCFAINDLDGYREHCLSEDGRIFLLSKSVFDLVKANHFLELTDSKLLGWYLSLPAKDRKLIQVEGGLLQFLHRHPALEVFRHIVYLKQYAIGNRCPVPALEMSSKLNGSRQATVCGLSHCVNCGRSGPSGAEKCRRCSTLFLNQEENVCIPEEEHALWLLPNNVQAELNLGKDKGQVSEDMATRRSLQSDYTQSTSTNMSGTPNNFSNWFQQPEQPRNDSCDGQILCQMWDGKEVQMFKDPMAQASLLLDRELEMQSHHQSSDYDQVPLLPDTNPDFSNLEKETLPEYYSFNSTTVGHKSSQWGDATNACIMPTEDRTGASTDDGPMTCGAENCTFPDSVSFLSNSSEWTDLTADGQNLSSEDETHANEYHSVTEEEASSSATCVPCFNPGWPASDQSTQSEFTFEECTSSTSLSELNVKNTTCEASSISLGARQTVDASRDFRACFASTRATEIMQDFVMKRCQDVSTATDLCLVNQATQTIPRLTIEKCTITEVYMSDLDAICEEFEEFRMMEEELLRLKDEGSRAGEPRNEQQQCHGGCGALSRARRAELRLLALQFAMCQQHCWRCFYTSPQGEISLQRIAAVPNAVSQTLKSLEDQYLKMKRKILEGVSLDNLKPLSVDTRRLKAGTCYRPSLIYEAFLGDCLPESLYNSSGLQDEGQSNQADEVLKFNATDHEHLNKNATTSQESATSSKTASSRQSRGVPGSRQSRGVPGSSQQAGVSNDAKPGAPKDLNSNDSWFDAAEELEYDGQSCKEDRQKGQMDQGESKKKRKVDANRKDQCFLLCVSNLPDAVCERDLLHWFAKYNTNQVSLSKFSNARVAIVSVRNPNNAEAAVREMNGRSIQGHVLHVEHLHKPPADGQITIKKSCIQLSPAAHEAGSAGEELVPQNVNNVHASSALQCNLDKMTNICTTPTATGTCVPQNYGTMGSFDTIMAQLLALHPNMGRQQIVGALLKLQTKHHGVLSGLPLKDIVDMTSELLTHSATD